MHALKWYHAFCFQVARLIKVTETDSPYFKVISPSDVGNKVAPGMDKVFMLQFTADQKQVRNKHKLYGFQCKVVWFPVGENMRE